MKNISPDATKEQSLIFELLGSALKGKELESSVKEALDQPTVTAIYDLAQKHDLAHVIAYGLRKNDVAIGDEIGAKLKKAETLSFYRNERLKAAFEQICKIFDENNIAYVALKGAIIRPYYPEENMRTSCDIDILIHEEELDLAIKLLEANEFRSAGRYYHDVSLYSSTKVHLELHFSVQENNEDTDVILKDAWRYAKITCGSRYEFSKEFFVFYMYAHMSQHFILGGCGLRALADIWIMENKMDCSYIVAEELLKKAGIYQFAKEMSELAEAVFSSKALSDGDRAVIGYIFAGGVYGSTENNVAVGKIKAKSSAAYFLKRLFLPYKTMTMIYPVLKKAPILLPFCWVARWINAIFNRKTGAFLKEMKMANNISAEKLEDVAYIRSRLGL